MTYVVTARQGEEERVLRAIKKLIEPSRSEPANSFYQASRDPDDLRVGVLEFDVIAPD